MTVPALVSVPWLRQQMLKNAKHIRVLDGTWHLPNMGIDAKKDHLHCRLPTSKYFDIDDCCDHSSPYPHMLPSEQQFSEYVEKLGINNDHHVVIYDTNKQFGLFSAPRIWWTFRVFGHNLVSVLDGGLPKWREHNYPIMNIPIQDNLPEGSYKPFKTDLQKHLIYNFESMKSNIDSPSRVQVGDARSFERFCGTGEEIRPGVPAGHIPKSKSLPFQHLLDPNTKQMKTPKELHEVFKKSGIDVNKPLIGSCGSGVTGPVIVFAAYLCGNKNAALYDGSWTEWAQRAPKELIAKVKE